MVDRSIHLPTSKPTKARIDRIIQIEFHLVISDNSPLIDVYARNTRIGEKYLWRKLPATYENALRRALYKLELLKLAVVCTNFDRIYYLIVSKYLVYMDNTLDHIWKEAELAVNSDEMSSNWRSPTLDRWILIECNVQRWCFETEFILVAILNIVNRHGDMEIDSWLEEMSISDQQLSGTDALQIGTQ